MRYGRIYRSNDRRLIVPGAMLATGMLERLRGLLGRGPLGENDGLLIDPCPSIHTFGMRYPIDVVFLDRDWRIAGIVAGLRPFRFAWRAGARCALELRAGAARRHSLSSGQQLAWQDRE